MAAPRRPLWTAEEDAQLCQLLSAGMSFAQIAGIMPSRTAKGADKRARKLARMGRDVSIPSRSSHWTAEQDGRLLAMLKRGMTCTAIAEVMGDRPSRSVQKRAHILRGRKDPGQSAGITGSDRWRNDAYRGTEALGRAVSSRAVAQPAVVQRPMSFEDQLAAVRAGAKIVRKFVPPQVDHPFTLAGSVGEIG